MLSGAAAGTNARTQEIESPPADWPRGWESGSPRVRGGKMHLVEVTQPRRRREPTMPAAPTSATAPGAGMIE